MCVCPSVCLSVCLSLGASADKRGDGAGPRKGSTFWKSKFDMKSNQLLQPIPSPTATAAHSTTKKEYKTLIRPFHSIRKMLTWTLLRTIAYRQYTWWNYASFWWHSMITEFLTVAIWEINSIQYLLGVLSILIRKVSDAQFVHVLSVGITGVFERRDMVLNSLIRNEPL